MEEPGRPVEPIELSNLHLTVHLLARGASLWRLYPTAAGPDESLVLGLASAADYAANPAYLGVTVGPFANRIAGAAFELDGVTHRLEPNEGPNQLHGGPSGFSRRLWAVDHDSSQARFSLRRPDGEGGYPGNLDLTVDYILDGPSLTYRWTATTDAATPVSLTNHTYWNLGPDPTVADHHLTVAADRLVEVDDAAIPTGRLIELDTDPRDTDPRDLRRPTRLGDVIDQIGGIDHSYWLDRPDGPDQILLEHRASGRRLTVTTTLPGVQVYTGQFLASDPTTGGHGPLAGVCLETQFHPDSPNQATFPSCIVRPDQPMVHETVYHFEL